MSESNGSSDTTARASISRGGSSDQDRHSIHPMLHETSCRSATRKTPAHVSDFTRATSSCSPDSTPSPSDSIALISPSTSRLNGSMLLPAHTLVPRSHGCALSSRASDLRSDSCHLPSHTSDLQSDTSDSGSYASDLRVCESDLLIDDCPRAACESDLLTDNSPRAAVDRPSLSCCFPIAARS
jgi:hypothetical protein